MRHQGRNRWFQKWVDELGEEEAIRKDNEWYQNCNFNKHTKGNKNHAYGKSWKQMMVDANGKEQAEIKIKELSEKRRERSIKDKVHTHFPDVAGKNNPMYGRSVYSVWVEKYGKEIADKKMESYRKKQSENTRGKKNPMFGKPSPSGSGKGYSGWYKQWYFRSLMELTFIIRVIERYNLKWELGEQKKYTVPYIFNGAERTYRPDFVIEGKYMVEIKPRAMKKNEEVKAKAASAETFCKKRGMKYKLFTGTILPYMKIKAMYVEGVFTLNAASEKRFEKHYQITNKGKEEWKSILK
jgi:hypothetical protein